MSRPLSRSIGRLTDTNGLVAALVIATYPGRPIRQIRPLPPTLNRQWGGLLRQGQLSCRREQTIGLLVRTSRRCKSSRRQIRQMWPLPPTLNRPWGGLHRRLCLISRRRERTIGFLVRIYLPPSNPSPLKVPLQLTRGGGFNDSFRDNGVILPPRVCPRRKFRPRLVGRRHDPRAPNPLDHLHCGGRHRPRASNQSTRWASA
jgi:hypothetical protein